MCGDIEAREEVCSAIKAIQTDGTAGAGAHVSLQTILRLSGTDVLVLTAVYTSNGHTILEILGEGEDRAGAVVDINVLKAKIGRAKTLLWPEGEHLHSCKLVPAQRLSLVQSLTDASSSSEYPAWLPMSLQPASAILFPDIRYGHTATMSPPGLLSVMPQTGGTQDMGLDEDEVWDWPTTQSGEWRGARMESIGPLDMSPHLAEFVGTGSTTPIPPGKGPPEEPSLASMVPALFPALNIILRGRLRLCVMNRRQRRVKAGQPCRRPIASKPSLAGISNMAWLLGGLTLLLMVIHMASTVLGAAHSSDIIGDGHPPSGEDYWECPIELANSWLSVMSPPISNTLDEPSSSRLSPSSSEAQSATGDTMLCDDEAHGNQPDRLSGFTRPWTGSPMPTKHDTKALKRQRRELPPSPCYELSISQADPRSVSQSTGLTIDVDVEASATTSFLGAVYRPRNPSRSGGLKRQKREAFPPPSYGLGASQAVPMSESQSTGLTLVEGVEDSPMTSILRAAPRPRIELTAQELQESRSNTDPMRRTDYGFSACPPRTGYRCARDPAEAALGTDSLTSEQRLFRPFLTGLCPQLAELFQPNMACPLQNKFGPDWRAIVDSAWAEPTGDEMLSEVSEPHVASPHLEFSAQWEQSGSSAHPLLDGYQEEFSPDSPDSDSHSAYSSDSEYSGTFYSPDFHIGMGSWNVDGVAVTTVWIQALYARWSTKPNLYVLYLVDTRLDPVKKDLYKHLFLANWGGNSQFTFSLGKRVGSRDGTTTLGVLPCWSATNGRVAGLCPSCITTPRGAEYTWVRTCTTRVVAESVWWGSTFQWRRATKPLAIHWARQLRRPPSWRPVWLGKSESIWPQGQVYGAFPQLQRGFGTAFSCS
jgi:hypothetical protein